MSYRPNMDLVAASERTRKQMQRVMYATVAIASTLFFGGAAGAVYLANGGRVVLLREIATGVGVFGIVLALAFIIYLLSHPPFSTGEWRGVLREARPRLNRPR